MGLLSKAREFVQKKFSSETREKVYQASNTALAVLTSPISFIRDKEKTKRETEKKGAVKLVAEGVENTLLAVAPFSATGKSLAVKGAKTAFGSVKNTAITLGATGALISSPTLRSAAIQAVTPSNIVATGQKIGEVVEKGKGTKAGDVLTSALVTGATGLGAGALAVAGYDYVKDKLSNDKTDTTPYSPTGATPVASLTPITPQTETFNPSKEAGGNTNTKKRRKRRSKPKQTPSINIRIDNRDDWDRVDRKIYKGGRY